MTADDFTAQLQALLPPGKAWTRKPDSLVTKSIEGCSPEFARAQGRADDILREANPGEAVEMLPEHEDLNGVVASGTTSQRQAALLAKLQDKGGHNPADYTAWALGKGFAGVVVRRRPIPPFRAGDLAGSRAHGTAWAHAYIVEYMPDILTPAANAFGSWTILLGSVTSNYAQGPDGDPSLAADRINGDAAMTAAIASSDKPTLSLWLKAYSGAPVAFIAVGTANISVPLLNYWRRYQISTTELSVSQVALGISAGNALAWGAYVGAPNATFESDFYARQQASAAPLFRVIGDYPKD
jgi:uncharacterized protein YmfQ (DUF2313 family)